MTLWISFLDFYSQYQRIPKFPNLSLSAISLAKSFLSHFESLSVKAFNSPVMFDLNFQCDCLGLLPTFSNLLSHLLTEKWAVCPFTPSFTAAGSDWQEFHSSCLRMI